MQIHELAQGTPEWHAYRAQHFNASDAPAMLGISPYKSRSELLHERATGTQKEIDATKQSLFDNGHRFEALAGKLAEQIVGDDLYPVVGSLDVYSASFDGLTLDGRIAFEHKSMNDTIRAATCAADLPEHLRVQMEQQIMVSGAEKCLFLASKWTDGGDLIEEAHFWYEPDIELRQRIVDGWTQFKNDLETYQPKQIAEKPQADAIMQLPALAVQIRGEVMVSNLPQFKEAAEHFIAGIKTDLVSDEDFANAEATVKFCDKAEKDLELAKSAAIAQTASIDELMRTIDHIREQMRTKRLSLERLVKDKKELIKTSILTNAKTAFAEHVADLEAETKPIRLAVPAPDFVGAMKNKRTLASLHDAVDSELANGKIAADKIARDVRAKLAWCKQNAEGYGFLFLDLQHIISKAEEDFQMVITNRIESHKKAEAEKLEAERARIAEEERIKAEQGVARQQAILEATQQRRDEEKTERAAPAAAAVSMPAHSSPPTLRLGQINERIAPLTVSAEGLRTLGFEPAARDKSALLFREADFPLICAALINHINHAQARIAA